MEQIYTLLHTLLSFFVILSVIVFIHEFGHYIVAKWCGVKVDAFSIGFGKEIFGWNDKSGTRWKISLLPLGGYVKMYGDETEASTPSDDLEHMSAEERQLTFHHKPLYKKALIVSAGPVANFLLTIAVLTYFVMTVGIPSTEPVAGEIMPDSPALEAGLVKGDRITAVNDDTVEVFNDIPRLISTNLGTPVTLHFIRDGKQQEVTLTPATFTDKDALGNEIKRPLIGIRSVEIKYTDVGLLPAVGEAVKRTYEICTTTLHVVGQMIVGDRGASDLKGPIGIAKLSGQATEQGMNTILWFIAMLSANLGLINLFPIPVLDGGHLLYYAVEAVRGKPMAQRFQEYGFKVGFALIACLMAFTIFNDVRGML